MGQMFYYLFVYFKGEKIPVLFFPLKILDRELLWSKMPVKVFATGAPERLQLSLTRLHPQTRLAGSWYTDQALHSFAYLLM